MFARRHVTLGVLACMVSAAKVSAADSTPSLALSPAPAGNRSFLVERAGVYGDLVPSARVLVDYAHQPLVLRNGSQEIDRVVTQQIVAHGLFSLSLAHRFLFHVGVPLRLSEDGDAPPASGATAPRHEGGLALGDARLGGRAVLFGAPSDAETRFDFALAASVWLPTASSDYVGDTSMRAGGSGILEGSTAHLYWAVNAGLRTRPSETLAGVVPTRAGTALVFGAAAGFFADQRRHVSLGAEIAADFAVGNDASLLDPRSTAAQALVGAHWRPGGGPFEIGTAVGPGLGQGVGSSAFRVLTLIGLAQERRPPPPDHDRDGIPDKTDACIDSPGVASFEPLLNGCPPPPLDRDDDGIPDERDACPSVAGKPTYIPASHGCPAGTLPAPPPPPPPPPPVAALTEREITIAQQIQFETNSPILRSESEPVLREVARILALHPALGLVEVQGHTDDAGTPALNQQLSEARAKSVVDWLATHDVSRDRLQPRGYGATRPIADNATEQGREKNRRVEFHILRRGLESPPREERP